MAKLLLKFKNAIAQEISLIKPIVSIGRTDENDIVIDNLGVSRFHAQITEEDGKYYVEDMESANGTLLNGKPLTASEETKRCELQNKDEIEIGKHKLIFLAKAEVSQEERDAAETVIHKRSAGGMVAEETVHVGDIKTKSYRRLTPGGLKTEIKEAGVKILEGGVDQDVVKFTRVLTVAGKGPTVDIRIQGTYEKDVLFVISKRPDGYFISPPKGCALKIDGQEIKDHTRLHDGSLIEVEETKMEFYIVF